jgi:large subunit ribosomal protein L35
MPKLKTKKGALKRFFEYGKGRLKHRCANRSHINTKMTSKRKRYLRLNTQVARSDLKSLYRQLPFL